MKQEYALKEYVSENNYGKVINGSSSEILINCNLTGDEAEAKIVALFGSIIYGIFYCKYLLSHLQ